MRSSGCPAARTTTRALHGWHPYSEAELKEMLDFANAGAALITTRKGALRVMPERSEIEALL